MPIFLHPLLLTGLLGVGLPWLWWLIQRRRQKIIVFPSLFYFRRLQKTASKPRPPWLEALLFSLLIAFTVLALAHPVSKTLGPSVGHLTVFVDLTPSLPARHPQWRRSLAKALEDFSTTHPGATLSLAGWNSVREGNPAEPFSDLPQLLARLDESPVDNGGPLWSQFQTWWGREALRGEKNTLLVVSAFSPLRQPVDFDAMGLDLGPPSSVTALSAGERYPLAFEDETPVLPLAIHHRGPPTNCRLSVRDAAGRSQFVDTIAIEAGEQNLLIPLPGLTAPPGSDQSFHPVEVSLTGGATGETFALVRREAILTLTLFAPGPKEASALDHLLRHDLDAGHFKKSPDGQVLLMAGMGPESLLKVWRGRPAVILLRSGDHPDQQDDGLARILGLGLRVTAALPKEARLTPPDEKSLPPALWDLARLKGWDQIKKAPAPRLDLESGAQPLWAWSDGSPFLIRDGTRYVLAGALGETGGLLEHPLAVALITSLALSARSGPGPFSKTPDMGPLPGRPLLEGKTPSLCPTGIFQGSEGPVAINDPAGEITGDPLKPKGLKQLSLQNFSQRQGPLALPPHRILAGLAMLCLLLLCIRPKQAKAQM